MLLKFLTTTVFLSGLAWIIKRLVLRKDQPLPYRRADEGKTGRAYRLPFRKAG